MRLRFVAQPTLALVAIVVGQLFSTGNALQRAVFAAEPKAGDAPQADATRSPAPKARGLKNQYDAAPYFAGPPGTTAYVSVDRLPVFSTDGLTDIRLKLGQEVSVVHFPTAENITGIRWTDAGEQKSGTVTRYGLSRSKPDAVAAPSAPSAPAPADEAPTTAAEKKRLSGTWMTVGLKVLGHTNPDGELQVSEKDGPNPPAGLVGPTGDRGMWYFTPHTTFHRFHDGTLTKWTLQPNSITPDKMVWLPQLEVEVKYDVDATTTPRRLDQRFQDFGDPAGTLRPGIYRWHSADVLEWAAETPWHSYIMELPTIPGRPGPARPAGFAPDQLKKATVFYLVRVDEKRYPPPAPRKTRAQQQGGNAF